MAKQELPVLDGPARPAGQERGRRRVALVVATLLVTITATAVLLLVVEFGYRLWRHRALNLPAPMYVPDTLLAFRLNPERPLFHHSFVGDGVPETRNGRLVVLCLGASTTFGHGVSAAQAWPGALRDSLAALRVPAAVVNAGVSGYGSRQLLLRYRSQIAGLRPDVVIVYEGWNRTGILSDDSAWEPFGVGQGSRWLVAVSNHSLLARRVLGWRYQRRQLAFRDWQPEPLQGAWEADMDSLIREVRLNGQHGVVVLYPGLYHGGMTTQDLEAYAGRGWKGRDFDAGMLAERDAKHAALRRIAAREGALLLDADSAFAERRGLARLELFLDEMHLSAAGGARFAGLVARALHTMLLVAARSEAQASPTDPTSGSSRKLR